MDSLCGITGAFWGLTGVVLLLGSAVYRLSFFAFDAIKYPFNSLHWTGLFVIVFFMSYAEGYQGFQKKFSPRVAARALYLRRNPEPMHIVFAPLFCMGFFHATPRRIITSFSVTFAIICLIVAVRYLTQPWRGIVDAGVVIGLMWGIISLLFYIYRAFVVGGFEYSPDVPDEKSPRAE